MFGILMLLGPFRFSCDTAPYDETSHATAWEWPEQPLIGQAPVLQYTGPRVETLRLRGRLFPGHTGGVEQLAQMRALAGFGKPMFLIDGMGRVYGNWVIEQITDTGTIHHQDGQPRHVTFDIDLKKYNDGTGLFGLITKASSLVSLFR